MRKRAGGPKVVVAMQRFRPFISLCLALVLLAQGMGVAVASASMVAGKAPTGDMAGMPCHGDQQADNEEPSCCDATCPDMTSCALSHIALAAPAGLTLAVHAQTSAIEPLSVPLSFTPQTPLRPPIASHG